MQTFSLPRLLLSSGYNVMYQMFRRKSLKMIWPKKIGKFMMKKSIEKIGTSKDYQLALFQDKHGKKYLAKAWVGSYKDFAYYSLKNEVLLNTTLCNTQERLRPELQKEFKKVFIPKIVYTHETDNACIVFFEFVEDSQIAQNVTNAQKKLTIYKRATDYIHFLGKHVLPTEKKMIAKRSVFDLIYLYPILLMKAFITHPRATGELLKGAYIFSRNIRFLIKEKNVSLIHRDLHFKNIMIKNDSIMPIDLQLCVYSHILYEYVTTLRYRWLEDEFYLLLLNDIFATYSKLSNFTEIFQSLCIHSATHGLTGKRFPGEKINKWINFLSYANNLKERRKK